MEKKDRKLRLGSFPLYPPLELFYAMGLNPVLLWGLESELSGLDESDRRLQGYCCSVARRLVQFVLTRGLETLDGLFMYNACDTLRNLPEIIEAGLGEKGRPLPFFKMHLPMAFRDQVDAASYFRRRIAALIEELEQAYGVRFEPDRFRQCVLLFQKVRMLALKLEERVAAGQISYADFSDCLQRGCFADPEEQLRSLQALEDQGSRLPCGKREDRLRVVISGILPPPRTLIEAMEQSGLQVAGNDVALQRRSYGYQPAVTGDPLRYYHDFYTNRTACPTLLYTSTRRVEELLAYVRARGAAGVIFAGEKFCEYEYFEFPYLQRRLKEQGVHTMLLELSAEDTGKGGAFNTRVEAFSEMLKLS